MVHIDVKCPWCLVHNEDAVHTLFTCVFVNSVWAATGLQNLVQVLPNEKVFDILNRVFITSTNEQIVLVAVFCWSLWNRRNKWVWERVNMSVFGVKEAAMNLLSDWRKAQQEGKKPNLALNLSSRRWTKPPVGWVKVNTDAAIFLEQGSIGIGCVIRDEHGQFLRAQSQKIETMAQPREAEALSMKEALSWSIEVGVRRCMVETDAKLLAEACKGTQGRSYFHTSIMDCIELLKHSDSVLVEFVHRFANKIAHLLARASSSMSGVQEWVGAAPKFVSDAIISDIS